MKKITAMLTICLGLILLAGAAARGDMRYDLVGMMEKVLAESQLVQDLDLAGGKNPRTSLGAFGVGNGRVFSLIGLDMPQNRLFNMMGPDYETGGEWLGPVWHTLEHNGEPVVWERSRLFRIPRTGVIVCMETSEDLGLITVTYAPPGQNSIYRMIGVVNESDDVLEGLRLIVEAGGVENPSRAMEDVGLVQELHARRMAVSFEDAKNDFRDGRLVRDIGVLPTGNVGTYYLKISFTDTEKQAETDAVQQADVKPAIDLLMETIDWWNNWLDGALAVTAPGSVLDEFFENTLVLLKTQTAIETGAVGVMSRYSGAWCRDGYGPIIYYLAAGKFDEARRIAEFYDLASRMVGFRNRYPLNLDLSEAPAEFDWDSISPQHGDDPNVLIMHVYNYWRATGDLDFVRARYPYMRRNLTGQEHTDYRLPFHGDETYQVYVMMQDSAPMTSFYSVDTSFWHVRACEALSEMAAALGEQADADEFARRAAEFRDKTEQHYWSDERNYYIPYVSMENLTPSSSPFANINLRPLWNGYGDPSDPRMRRNMITTARKLMNKAGTMKTTTRVSYYTGMTPGLLLYNFKAIGMLDRADKAYKGLIGRAMSPTGEFAEAYDGNDRWLDYFSYANVYRPWETGIDAHAVLYYITGMQYDHRTNRVTLVPHLPPDVDEIHFKNLFVGSNRIAMSLIRKDSGKIYVEVLNTGDAEFELELLTEPAPDDTMEDGVEEFEFPAYGRTMHRRVMMLKPKDRVSAFSATGS